MDPYIDLHVAVIMVICSLTLCHAEDAASSTQQTQNIGITFVQRRTNVFDVGPKL